LKVIVRGHEYPPEGFRREHPVEMKSFSGGLDDEAVLKEQVVIDKHGLQTIERTRVLTVFSAPNYEKVGGAYKHMDGAYLTVHGMDQPAFVDPKHHCNKKNEAGRLLANQGVECLTSVALKVTQFNV
jgi:hypothetical protein